MGVVSRLLRCERLQYNALCRASSVQRASMQRVQVLTQKLQQHIYIRKMSWSVPHGECGTGMGGAYLFALTEYMCCPCMGVLTVQIMVDFITDF